MNSEIRTRSDTGNEGPVNPAEDHSAWWASLKSGLLIAPLILTSRRLVDWVRTDGLQVAHCRLELPGKAVSLQVTPRREHRDLRLEALAGYALCDGETEVHVRLIFHPLGPDDLEEAARPDVTYRPVRDHETHPHCKPAPPEAVEELRRELCEKNMPNARDMERRAYCGAVLDQQGGEEDDESDTNGCLHLGRRIGEDHEQRAEAVGYGCHAGADYR